MIRINVFTTLLFMFIVLNQFYSVIIIQEKYSKCKRNYPTDNLILNVQSSCIYNPFTYMFSWNESFSCININMSYTKEKISNNYLFFTIADDNSFKYLKNLYDIFLKPYKIKSLVTIVFHKSVYKRCISNKIFCIKIKWPYFLNEIKTIYKMKVWFIKYYLFYIFIKNNISILYIDSDIIFIQNCLSKLLIRNEDIVLLKSQSSQVFGNAGIVYI